TNENFTCSGASRLRLNVARDPKCAPVSKLHRNESDVPAQSCGANTTVKSTPSGPGVDESAAFTARGMPLLSAQGLDGRVSMKSAFRGMRDLPAAAAKCDFTTSFVILTVAAGSSSASQTRLPSWSPPPPRTQLPYWSQTSAVVQ